MVNDPIAVVLKFVFLAVLFLFVLWVARSALRDVAGSRAAAYDPLLFDDEGRAPIDLQRGVRPQLVVVAANGYAPGSTIELTGGATLGRNAPSDIVIEDPFASTDHARIVARGPHIYLEDLGSTNGTFYNGSRLTTPVQLQPGDTITIGDTEFRYEE